MEKAIALFKEEIRHFKMADQERIYKALELTHSTETASILLELGLDADAIIASLLLDCFRSSKSPESFVDHWGTITGNLLLNIKSLDELKTVNKTIHEAQNIRNMMLALTGDIRVILIKLAEKLQIMRGLEANKNKEWKIEARECLDIYAPLADRLGISWIKNEMEDLSLKFLYRDSYQQIKTIVAEKRIHRKQFLDEVLKIIAIEAETAGINVELESRAKHFYSIYMKMRKRGKSAEDIYDLSGVRIICEDIENCYTLLGIVHKLWKPTNGHFRDYIARPKPNGYQSLHTSVIISNEFEQNRIIEIQIRSKEMHQIAENGIASHWLYKQRSNRNSSPSEDINTAINFKDWKISEVPDRHEVSLSWLEKIKKEVFGKWIYVFTPQGRVIKLPAGATPIDFAYHVHSAVGDRCIGAKANGSIIPLSLELKNTQVIEILTSTSAHPHLNWLNMVKTSKARSKIRSWLGKNDDSFIAEKKKAAQEIPAISTEKSIENTTPIAQMLIQPLASALQVRIEDEKNMMIRFARCCNPVTGDSIIGYVSRGRGIIIHRKNCRSIEKNIEYEKRIIEAEWEKTVSTLVKRFRIEAKHSSHIFSEIEGAIRKKQGHLIEGRLEESSTNRLSGIFAMQLANADDLKTVVKSIRGIPGIINIQPIN